MTTLPRLDRIVIVWMFVLVMCSPICSAKTWRQYTFEHFRQGQSDDGGVNLYAAADGTLRTTTSFDYNSDGANDILFVCSHDNGYAPPTYIYPNDEGRFDRRFRWLLLNEGAHGGTIADLNDDGQLDLLLGTECPSDQPLGGRLHLFDRAFMTTNCHKRCWGR